MAVDQASLDSSITTYYNKGRDKETGSGSKGSESQCWVAACKSDVENVAEVAWTRWEPVMDCKITWTVNFPHSQSVYGVLPHLANRFY